MIHGSLLIWLFILSLSLFCNILGLLHIEKTLEIKNKSYFLKLQKSPNSYTDRQSQWDAGGQQLIVHTYNRAVGRTEKQREREGEGQVVTG